MSASVLDPNQLSSEVRKLFDEKSPVLVEIRFPKMGVSSDWFLCDSADALEPILDRLGAGVEVHLSSVWDLQNPTGAAVLLVSPPLTPT